MTTPTSVRIAVIGAGLSGLACARALHRAGHTVTVLDKGRGPGGRTSTRRDGTWRFDHGAPRLELGDPALADLRLEAESAGVIAPWSSAHGPTWIGVPGASALASWLARDLDVRTAARVTALARSGSWTLSLETGGPLGPFDEVVLTPPAPQTRDLLATVGAGVLIDAMSAARFAPCLAAMVLVRTAAGVEELSGEDGPLAVAYRMDHRPGREASEGLQSWVLHGREDWSTAHVEDDPAQSAAALAQAFSARIAGEIVRVQGHRWRFARATARVAASHLRDAAQGLTLAGDWFEAGDAAPAASRALLSGLAAAHALEPRG